MTDGTTQITRRRLLGGLLTVGGASAAAGAGTMAYFRDSETSGGNTVTAGTIDLVLGGSGSFAFNTALAPSQSTSGTLTLLNSGSVGGSVDVDVSYSENDASGNDQNVSADDLASNLTVETLTYGGNDQTDQVAAAGPQPTLQELATNDLTAGETTGNDLVDLPDPGAGTPFTLGLRLENVGNQFQSDGINITLTFHLNQTDGQ